MKLPSFIFLRYFSVKEASQGTWSMREELKWSLPLLKRKKKQTFLLRFAVQMRSATLQFFLFKLFLFFYFLFFCFFFYVLLYCFRPNRWKQMEQNKLVYCVGFCACLVVVVVFSVRLYTYMFILYWKKFLIIFFYWIFFSFVAACHDDCARASSVFENWRRIRRTSWYNLHGLIHRKRKQYFIFFLNFFFFFISETTFSISSNSFLTLLFGERRATKWRMWITRARWITRSSRSF